MSNPNGLNPFSGRQADADEAMQGQKSRSGIESNSIATNNVPFSDEERNRRRNAEDSHYLFVQLNAIARGIAALDDLIDKYGRQVGQLEDQMTTIDTALAQAPELQDKMQEYYGHAGLNRLYREQYSQFSAQDGSKNGLWAQMNNNVLKDSQGQMVYMDATGQLYRLQTDGNGQFVEETDPVTGAKYPAREYYRNEREVLELYEKIYTGDPPAIVANKSPLGQDPRNNIYDEINQWGIDFKNLGQHSTAKQVTPDKPEDDPTQQTASAEQQATVFATVEKLDDSKFVACDQAAAAVQFCTLAKYDLASDIKVYKKEEAAYQVKIQNAKEAYEQAKASSNTSPEQLAKLKAQVDTLTDNLNKRTEELQTRINNNADPLTGHLSFLSPKENGQTPLSYQASLDTKNLWTETADNIAKTGSSSATETAAPAPAPTFNAEEARLQAAVKNQIESNTITAQNLAEALKDATPEQAEKIIKNLSQDGITITGDTSLLQNIGTKPATISAGVPVAFGGTGTYAPVAEASTDLPRMEAQPISVASTLDPDQQSSKMNSAFAKVAAAPAETAPQLAQNEPEQNLRISPSMIG